jgi:hypothetical protein
MVFSSICCSSTAISNRCVGTKLVKLYKPKLILAKETAYSIVSHRGMVQTRFEYD